MVEESEDSEDETEQNGDKIKEIFQPTLEEFEELIAKSEDKKYFIGGVMKILTILFTTKCSSVSKLRKIIKPSAQIVIKPWTEPKQTEKVTKFYTGTRP